MVRMCCCPLKTARPWGIFLQPSPAGKGYKSGKGNNTMAEIKSTLDIVLERTKNLTMTQEEKASIQRKELEGRIRGWVKKYLDGLMDLKKVKTEMAAIPENQRQAGRDCLKNLVLEHFGAQGDAGKALDLLDEVLEESREPYLAAFRNFQKKRIAERSRLMKTLRAGLAARGISGSAVMPNLDGNEAWALFEEKALAEFRKGLALIGRDS